MGTSLYAVIMAGGSGTRFWPQSRKSKPKQLLSIVGNKTMIRATVDRLLQEIGIERMLILSSESCAEAVRKELPELPPEKTIAEPFGRNTAPCIALAAYKIAKEDPDALMAVLPADHLISRESIFLSALLIGAEAAAKSDHLVTFGIVPDRPETGYGYIQRADAALYLGHSTVFHVGAFVEKPDIPTAKKYVSRGDFFWNSGMFVWKVSAIINAFRRHLPEIAEVMESRLDALNTPAEEAALIDIYNAVPNISIDYGIMEKADNVLVIPLDCGWNDIGSWSSLHSVWDGDPNGNAIEGQAICVDSDGCIVCSPHKLTTLIGVQDLIVVDTPDALLVCRRNNAQDVKKLQELLEAKGYKHLL